MPAVILDSPREHTIASGHLPEKWWRSFFESSEDAQVVCRSDGLAVKINPKAARLLNAELGSCSARQVHNRIAQLSTEADVPPLMLRICQRIERLMRDFDSAAVEDVFSDGLLNVMSEPEFSQSEKLRRVCVALQNRDYLGSLVRNI